MEDKLAVLIIEPDGDYRARIRHALRESGKFGAVEFTESLEENVRKIAFGTVYDVIFVSQRLPAEQVSAFIRRAKETQSGQDSTYIMIVHLNDETAGTIGLRYAFGVDGFLLQPFSPQQFAEIVDLSFQVKQERAEIRNRVGLTLLVADLVDQLNLIAYLKSSGFDVSLSFRKLYEMCKPLQELNNEALSTYFEIVLSLFPESPFPSHLKSSDEYKGLSERVRKRMERKLIAELDTIKNDLKKSREDILHGVSKGPKTLKKEED